ncbi:Uma2 family endonuclease [Streptomyces sp. NPDC057682]|uniref:Uma2 family endonuclease n=1 Tax=Streptomyces sp. NPDC057682 TaxID=3346210 RepID=UPI0036B941A2
MSAKPHEPLSRADVLLGDFFALDPPEGFRAELIEGDIVLTPPPDGNHEYSLSVILDQVIRYGRTGMDFSANKGLRLRGAGGCPDDHAIPDGTFAPTALRLYRGADPWMPCEGVALVVEVTSSKPVADRTAKRHCYARGPVPLYLLVDREESSVTLFSDPGDDDYRQHCTIPFGKEIHLPAPFALDLRTDEFI